MMYMNEYEIEMYERQHGWHPVLGPAVQTLRNLMEWTNSHSDGWAYWPKPCRAAKNLQVLIQGDPRERWNADRLEVTAEQYKAALKPIKAFRTRQGADFEIVEV